MSQSIRQVKHNRQHKDILPRGFLRKPPAQKCACGRSSIVKVNGQDLCAECAVEKHK